MTTSLAIEVESDQVPAYQKEGTARGIEVESFALRRFDGGVAVSAVIIPLLSATLPFVTKMILGEIAARRHIKVKANGVEITGLSGEEIVKVLETMAQLVPGKK
ncbi:hypothetical protein HB774_02630 [Rhizobium leguminosarum bv. viciae]|nr:hypothetical protein HB774_02630 [Rhizobium leguminosarum bv. viciae]